MKCYWKAHCVGDIEGGIALSKLAKLYEKTNEADQAAAAYTQVKFTLFACIENLVKYLSDAMLNFLSLFNDSMENVPYLYWCYYASSLRSTVHP